MNAAYQRYLHSDTWRDIRDAVRRRDHYRCRVCNSRRQIQCHHRVYPQVLGTEPLEDLITMCDDCHSLFSHRKHGRHHRLAFCLGAAAILIVQWLMHQIQ